MTSARPDGRPRPGRLGVVPAELTLDRTEGWRRRMPLWLLRLAVAIPLLVLLAVEPDDALSVPTTAFVRYRPVATADVPTSEQARDLLLRWLADPRRHLRGGWCGRPRRWARWSCWFSASWRRGPSHECSAERDRVLPVGPVTALVGHHWASPLH